MQILAYVLGIGFLVACVFGVVLIRKVAHERMLATLGIDGATIAPRFWSLSGLLLMRPRWEAAVVFEAARVGGGRPGHLRFAARFEAPELRPAPEGADLAPIRTGDDDFDRKIVVEGDPAFARKLLVPEMRGRLIELDRMGGRILAIGQGTIEIGGPLLTDPAALKRFLELCDAIVSGTVTAAGA